MSKKMAFDMNTLRIFYDPHPGFAGALVPMPDPVKKVANELDGQKLSLRVALKKLKAVTNGTLSLVAMDNNFIMLKIKGNRGTIHYFRVISFR